MPGLTAADLKSNLHDIQDNIVAPIQMRYGRHVFFKFTDGVKARAWLRRTAARVNGRREEHGTRFTINIGFTYEGLKALRLSEQSLDSFPEAFRVGMRGRASLIGDIGPHAPENWEGDSAAPTFTRWRGYGPFPTKVARRRPGSFATRWPPRAALRSGLFRTPTQ